LRKNYTGGHTDVYQLYSNKECRLYDFVSLYPSVMAEQKFPSELKDKFSGNPFDIGYNMDYLHNNEILSFIFCDIYVDKSINRPVYQTHIKVNNQIKTICATGIFRNQLRYVLEMLKYQELTNNKIRIIEDSITGGYRFKSAILFDKIINGLFEIKKSVSKSDPIYLIAKILMNSMYGRFGLNPMLQILQLVNTMEIDNILLENNLSDNLHDELKIDDTDKSLLIFNETKDNLNISVAIASAVSAYARLKMAPILLDESIPVLYTDTDSIVIEGDLATLNNGKYSHLLHNDLGGLKLKSVFLAPKLYGGIYQNDNSEIVKVKGFKDKIRFDILKRKLFNKESFILSQVKWYKSIKEGSINIKSNPYTLALNENKRILDIDNLRTLPYHFK
jgi:hypothetical protein